MTAAGNFAVELTWDSDPGAGMATKTAIPRPGTRAGAVRASSPPRPASTRLGANLDYTSATKSLTFRLQKDNFDPAA